MHEIVTLQLGRQSNYAATHFWNAQESYFTYGQEGPSPVDHDIHWRAGLGADGSETYLPRTVIYERKGGFGSLRKVNALYEVQDENSSNPSAANAGLWPGQAIVQRAPAIPPNAYMQSLDAGVEPPPLTPAAVRYWSDFSRVYYHPRSLVEVGNEPEGAESQSDMSWAAGEALFSTLDREHDLLDRDLRPFVEESDHMQGLQVLASVDDAWGGFAARYLERLRDEYGKSTVWFWALQEPVSRMPREKRIVRLANKARTLVEAYSQASLVIPLAMPSLPLKHVTTSLDLGSAWHTSALMATAMETATLPARLRAGSGGDSLAYLTELLNATGKQTVANLQMSAVQPWQQISKSYKAENKDNVDGDQAELHLDIDFAPRDDPSSRSQQSFYSNGTKRAKKARMFGQAVVTRNSEADDDDDDKEDDREDNRRGGVPDRRDMAQRRFALKPVSQKYSVDLRFPLLDSFPRIYQSKFADETSVPVTTGLATDSAVADRITALRTTVVAPWAIALEDREAISNDLAGMADAYHEGWSSGSDEDDDDD